MKNFLNIGCGSVFNPSWTNIDIASSSSEVEVYDIRKGLPYPEEYFDACYSSHVLEHLTQIQAEKLLKECWRVLKPQGVIRVVVPDLESIIRNYLSALEKIQAGFKEVEPNYDWMMLELYDQVVRQASGGEMALFLQNPEIKNKEFVLSRVGSEAEKYFEKKNTAVSQKTFINKLNNKISSFNINRFRLNIAKALVQIVAGSESKKAFEQGVFRNSGEIHYWMYDSFSLGRLLEKSGFVDASVCEPTESKIPNFESYSLDTIAGKVRKPDSLFMEALKP